MQAHVHLVVYFSIGVQHDMLDAVCAYLLTMQLQGQATVPAAQSQVIYSSVPVWSALLAFVFMPEETMGLTGYVGGAVIVVAGLLAIR